jgi:hypothetical protein
MAKARHCDDGQHRIHKGSRGKLVEEHSEIRFFKKFLGGALFLVASLARRQPTLGKLII